MNTNNQPFYVGQKVVAIKNNTDNIFKKGMTFTIFGVRDSTCRCGTQEVNIGMVDRDPNPFCMCRSCSGVYKDSSGMHWFFATSFAPIEENRERIKYVAVSETLREKAQEVVIENLTTS